MNTFFDIKLKLKMYSNELIYNILRQISYCKLFEKNDFRSKRKYNSKAFLTDIAEEKCHAVSCSSVKKSFLPIK